MPEAGRLADLTINLESGFPYFVEVLRVALASANLRASYTVWYGVDDSKVLLYFIGDRKKCEAVPEPLLDTLLSHFTLFDYGDTPVGDEVLPLLGWSPPDSITQYWNESFSYPDTAATCLGQGLQFLRYGDIPTSGTETLLIHGSTYTLHHGHYKLIGEA
jgi:hypothetical protein